MTAAPTFTKHAQGQLIAVNEIKTPLCRAQQNLKSTIEQQVHCLNTVPHYYKI